MKLDGVARRPAELRRSRLALQGSKMLGMCDQRHVATITNNCSLIIHVDVDSEFLLA